MNGVEWWFGDRFMISGLSDWCAVGTSFEFTATVFGKLRSFENILLSALIISISLSTQKDI